MYMIRICQRIKYMQKIYPKCLSGMIRKSLTADGFIVPCCWVDNYKCRKDKIFKEFFKKEMHIDNFENIEDIEKSELWNNFYNMIKNNNKNLWQCFDRCPKPATASGETEMRDRIKYE